jgi:hypothetical protein
MNVHIKEQQIEMNLGNNGLLLGVADTKDRHIGSLRIGKARIAWHKGRKQDGIEVTWDELIEWFESRSTP